MATQMSICGYFATRRAQAEADIIVTPYQTILSEATRASVGISLFNKILVFDEAHNIMETVANLNTIRLSYMQLYTAYTQIQQYLRKYESRMGAKNSKFLRDLIQLAADFIKYIKLQWKKANQDNEDNITEKRNPASITIDVMDCLTELDIYRLDFAAMGSFFEKSDFIRKLNGYI